MKKIACLFPGIGYTCEKPLLYYTWKLLGSSGWEIIPVRYGPFPTGVKGDPEKMTRCAQIAMEQSEAILEKTDWSAYPRILFVGKSVGTAVGCAYAKRHQIACGQILFTPLEETFQFADSGAIAFHGTADPWADTGVIEECCARKGIPLYKTEGANHSLETGRVDFDIETLQKTMRIVREYTDAYGS